MARAGEEDLELHYTNTFGTHPPPQAAGTVQQTIDPVPLPTLDDPAPQMVEELPDVLSFFGALMPDPEQVTELPKILPEDVPQCKCPRSCLTMFRCEP